MRGATTIVIGGTSGTGREVARHFAALGDKVVVTGRDPERTRNAATEIGETCRGLACDLADPMTIADALAGIGTVDRLVVAAVERRPCSISTFDIDGATRLVMLKLVGYSEVVHVLGPRMTPSASIVLFGGVAFERPTPGSTTMSTVTGGIAGLVRTLATELAPVRVNGVHPGIIGDSPAVQTRWSSEARDTVISRIPIGRLVTMAEVVGAVAFLLNNSGVNGTNLVLDGGWLLG